MIARVALGWILGYFCVATAAAAATAPRLDAVLPQDTGVFLVIRDVSDFRARWPQSPLGRLWHDPALQHEPQDGDPLTFGLIHRATGLGLAQILDTFEDEAAFCSPDLEALLAADGAWAVAAVAADVQVWRDLAERIVGLRGSTPSKSSGDSRSAEPTGGILPASEGSPGLAWAWHDGVGFLGAPPSYVDALIASRKVTGDHLDTSPTLQKFGGEPADLRIYLDLDGLTDLLIDLIGRSEPVDSTAAAFMGISPEKVVTALGLEAFHGMLAEARLASDATLADFRVLVDDAPGLSRLIAYREGPCELPAIIPANAVHANVTRFDMVAFWRAFLEILDRIQPGLSSLAVYQLDTLTQASGLDFEKDVLGQLKNDTFLAYLPPPANAIPDTAAWDAFDQLSGVRVRDPEAMETTMAWLLAGSPMTQGGQAETREIEDVSVHSFKFGPSENSPAFSYAFRDSTLLLSSGLSDIIGRALTATRKPGGSLWDRPDIKSLLASVPREAASVAYWNPRGFEGFLSRYASSREGDPDIPQRAVGKPARSLLEAMGRHLGPVVTYSLRTPSEFFTRVRVTRGDN